MMNKSWITPLLLLAAVGALAGVTYRIGFASDDITEKETLECCSKVTRASLRTAPDGMVFIPGGTTKIGSETGLPMERPVFETEVKPFYMDTTLVTVAQFRAFVQETGYKTFSETVGDGIIFDFENAKWTIEPGVTWEYPMGTENGIAPDNHPVTLLTQADAIAYLDWIGKRLPSEIEWEHAARGISDPDKPYSWGHSLVQNGKPMANTWTGTFPELNNSEDGYLTTSPVGLFGKTDLGLFDMGGNVWEWTSDWYRSYADRDKPYTPGPNSEVVLRGGSFMCHDSYCHGFRVSARSNTPADNNMFHIGFRGVRDLH
jgi:sulfatase modifying factor 1